MTDFPIIFSAPMVRALLNGRKTMTRRLATPRSCEFGSIPNGKPTDLFWEHADWENASPDHGFPDKAGAHTYGYLHVPCHCPDGGDCPVCLERGWDSTSHRLYPRASPGDRLWVRENHWRWGQWDYQPSGVRKWRFWPEKHDSISFDDEAPGINWPHRLPGKLAWWWRPSIYLPRDLSRLALPVSAVKIERLLDITEDDAKAEGFEPGQLDDGHGPRDLGGGWTVSSQGTFCSAGGMFQITWSKLHPEWDGYSSPHVVATSFTVHKSNIDAMPAQVAA